MQNRHLYSIDILRGVAAFGIVACHLNLLPMTFGAWLVRWYSDMFVGLFALLSGYLMALTFTPTSAGVFHSWLRYTKRRVVRLLPAYIMWTAIYIVLGFVFDYFIRQGINPKWSIPGYVGRVIFLGNSSSHLWFLICLLYGQTVFALALCILPRLRGVAWLIIGAIMIVLSVCLGQGWFARYPLRLIAFLVTGYGLGAMPQISVMRSFLCSGILIVMLAVHFFASDAIPAFVRDWLVAVPLLMVVLKAPLSFKFAHLASILGATSMGVFLVHPIIAVGFGLVLRRFFAEPYGPIPIAVDWICVWAMSLGIALLLLRLPLTNRFVR